MKKQILALTFVMGLVGLVFSCSSDRLFPLSDQSTNTKDSVSKNNGIESKTFGNTDINSFFKESSVKTVKFTVRGFNDLPIKTPKNTQVWIYENNLSTFDNKPVTYPFDVEITELLTIKDMLLYNKPTVSYTDLLVTGGAINVQVKKDGVGLKVGMNPKIQLTATNSQDTEMSLFYEGFDQQERSTWQMAEIPDRQNPGGQNNEKNPEGLFFTERNVYTIFPSRFGWINVDKFYDYKGEKTKVKFTNKYPDIKSVLIFMLLPKINSIVRVYDGLSFEVPVGEEVQFIAVAKSIDGQFYSFFKNDTIKKDQLLILSLTETTEAKFLETLEKL